MSKIQYACDWCLEFNYIRETLVFTLYNESKFCCLSCAPKEAKAADKETSLAIRRAVMLRKKRAVAVKKKRVTSP